MNLNEIIQYAIVAVIFVIAVAWVVRRSKNKKNTCGCGSSNCPISKNCNNKDNSCNLSK
jgi:hypothetical protein